MKKLFCVALVLLFCATAFAQEIDLSAMSTDELKMLVFEAEVIIASRRIGFPTLDEYIELHNAAMPGVCGDKAFICRSHGPLEKGETNDTFTFSLYNDPDSFAMLIVEKESENILGAVACLDHYDNQEPLFLLDYIASLAHGTGFFKPENAMDALALAYSRSADLMDDLGLNEASAFTIGHTSAVLNESGDMKFSYACDEDLGILLTVSEA